MERRKVSRISTCNFSGARAMRACGGSPTFSETIMRPNVSYSENSFELAVSMLSVVTLFSRAGATVTAPASTAFNISGGYHSR